MKIATLALSLSLTVGTALADTNTTYCPTTGYDARNVAQAVVNAGKNNGVIVQFEEYSAYDTKKIIALLNEIKSDDSKSFTGDTIMTITTYNVGRTKVGFLTNDCLLTTQDFDPQEWERILRHALGKES